MRILLAKVQSYAKIAKLLFENALFFIKIPANSKVLSENFGFSLRLGLPANFARKNWHMVTGTVSASGADCERARMMIRNSKHIADQYAIIWMCIMPTLKLCTMCKKIRYC